MTDTNFTDRAKALHESINTPVYGPLGSETPEFAAGSDMLRCLLELRARLEALEAGATCPHIITGDEGTSYCALAEQVAAMESAAHPSGLLVERPATFDEDENDRRFEHAKATINQPAPAPADAGESEYTDAEWAEIQRWNKTDDTSPAPASLRRPTVPRNCRQRLMRDGKPYAKSGCEACGDRSPDWRLCEALLSHESNSPSERVADSSLISWLQEEVEVSSQATAAFTTLPSEDYYRTVVRGIARWLRKESEGHLGSGSYWAKRLEEESEQ